MNLSEQQERYYRTKSFCKYFRKHGSLYPSYWDDVERNAILEELEGEGLPRPEEDLPKRPCVVCEPSKSIYREPMDSDPIEGSQESTTFEYTYEAVERRIERLEQLFKLEGLL